MAKFKFRLQAVLDLKAKVEDLRKNEFGKAMAILEGERQKKIALEQQRTQAIDDLKANINSGIDPLAIRNFSQFIDILKHRIAAQQIVIQNAEAAVEEARGRLVEAMRDKKTLDTLKENDHIEFLEEEKKEEQKIIDEIVSYRSGMKLSNHAN